MIRQIKFVLFFLVSFLFSFSTFAQVSSLPNGFPENDLNEGKLLDAVFGFSSLGEQAADGTVLNVHIRIPKADLPLQIEIFDPDIYSNAVPSVGEPEGFFDRPELNTVPNFTEYLTTMRFELYPDVNLVGNSNNPVGGLVPALISDQTMDNTWTDFFQGAMFDFDDTNPNFDLACEPQVGGFCFFHLVSRWVSVADPTDVIEPERPHLNGFMVASNGLPFLAEGSTIGFIGIDETSDLLHTPNTDYDGIIALRALVTDPAGVCSLDIYDGDADYAGDPLLANGDPNPMYPDESDDPNTPPVAGVNNFFPFSISSALVPEGANQGAPADNQPVGSTIPSIGEAIFITVEPEPPTVPYGAGDCTSGCLNSNPSGDKEFELFRIAAIGGACAPVPGDPSTDPTDSSYDPDGGVPGDGSAPAAAADAIVDIIGPGFHRIVFNSMDANNTTFINVSEDVFVAEVFDFGDAPDSYQTLSTSGGPQHEVDARLTLGNSVDVEFEGVPTVNADGDDLALNDDEDGVANFNGLDTSLANQLYTLDVAVTNTLDPGTVATVRGWIDFDGNGTFDANEAASAMVNVGATSVMLAFVVPDDVVAGDTYARVRIAIEDASISTPGGEVDNGEVEDYKLMIEEGECIPCKGMQDITFEMSHWSPNRDTDEIVRVRVGNLLGQFSGSDFDAPLLFEGLVPNGGTIELNNIPEEFLGLPLTISVQGEPHNNNEFGKSLFYPDCHLELWTESGNNYIKFKVIDFEKNSDEICPEHCPEEEDSSGYVKDHFSNKSYNNNDGSRDWSGPWVERDRFGKGATGGDVRILYGKLYMRKNKNSDDSSIKREVNVCASDEVWLKFRYKTSYKVDSHDHIAVEVSADGGSWHEVDVLEGRQQAWKVKHYDISNYASANLKVRFRVKQYYEGYKEWFIMNWVEVIGN